MNTQTPSRYFRSGDLARVACSSCEGCGECCRGMGDTIVTDPYDIYQLHAGLGLTFADLLNSGRIGLHNENGLTLPHLAMRDESGACSFLGDDGRCTIHALRPGICRLFPLGRYYENRDFRYILQTHECAKKNLTKVKVKKWLGIENLGAYENYIRGWHFYLRDTESMLKDSREQLRRQVCIYIVKTFFAADYNIREDFYAQFAARLQEGRRYCGFAEK